MFENVAFALEVIGRPKHVIRQQVPAMLELVGLAGKEDRFPHQLSGGEQQRVSIARAFVNRPLILLADEPTGNLDPATCVGIMRLLDRINQTGTTVVMATHDQRIVDTMRRRVIELDRGSSSATRPAASTSRCSAASATSLRETRASLRRNITLTRRRDPHRRRVAARSSACRCSSSRASTTARRSGRAASSSSSS